MADQESAKKAMVRRYLDGFRKMDHAQILSCLTDDIEWTVFGFFRLKGKEAYDAAIEGEGFTGLPRLTEIRLIEEDDTVMGELAGEADREDGTIFRFISAETFVFRGELICERRAFLTPLNENDFK
ncbi:nuclear transport factor 2 family protein [Parvularcula marina]|uniref:Nuclear transport factor 2 family protein n=1 Tax=Parvularcula marina TaxID=2292771 RepID=A0A371RJ82_9PROT|nr:nuclear transport factor 2 family protein [Parvularcula marina]RFB05505.1 nuclear transport factor 2 family protein [Parvularcula marina]